MTIFSITLTGNNSDIIGDAIKSVVDWVDACIVIDTGVTDNSLQIAKEIAGNKYIQRTFKWINHFGEARNFGLEMARELGASWAVIVDTDERIHWSVDSCQDVIERLEGDYFLVSASNQNYMKGKLFRIPAQGKYFGGTKEYFYLENGVREELWEMTFSEVPKTQGAMLRKCQRDLEILRETLENEPESPHWLFYLGETYRNLGNYQGAIPFYQKCAHYSQWDEEGGWACFREAECWSALGNHQECLNACAKGLTKHPGMAELAWFAGYSCYYLGNYDHAIYWSHLSLGMGNILGFGKQIKRIGFKHLPALYEAPFDVLKFAYEKKGATEGVQWAEEQYQQAYKTRLSG